MTGRLRKSVTIGACLVFIVMNRRADFYTYEVNIQPEMAPRYVKKIHKFAKRENPRKIKS